MLTRYLYFVVAVLAVWLALGPLAKALNRDVQGMASGYNRAYAGAA